ncbi:MAG: molecular chaperone [Erythrobacter sp.]|jgi:P pilus assembly chaperone PapD|nr:molecular chaperone [Erythrobacter sp.]
MLLARSPRTARHPERPVIGHAARLLAAWGLALVSLAAPAPSVAQGDLLIAPTRVILDARRGTQVILSNIGSEEATYRIELELRRMLENGRLVPVETTEASADETAAMEMIRYAPRRITLPPGQPQAVRLAARPSADLPDGEYRVHMSFKAIPKPRDATQTSSEADGVQIKLIPIYGVTIPIIVRHGKVEAQVAIDQPRVVAGEHGPELALTLSRSGDSSTYGELRVMRPGSEEPLVVSRGLAIYTDITAREVRIPLTAEQVQGLTGQLRFEYREMPEDGGALIASVDSVLG